MVVSNIICSSPIWGNDPFWLIFFLMGSVQPPTSFCWTTYIDPIKNTTYLLKMGIEIQLKKLAFSRLKIRVVLRRQRVCFIVSHHPCGWYELRHHGWRTILQDALSFLGFLENAWKSSLIFEEPLFSHVTHEKWLNLLDPRKNRSFAKISSRLTPKML